MSRKKKKKKMEQSEVPISSMIDVVFLLLTFFIFTSKEIVEEAYVDLKPGGGKPPENQSVDTSVKLDVTIEPDKYLYLGQTYELDALDRKVGRLALADPDEVKVTMITSLDSDHSRLVALLDICKKYKIKDFDPLSKILTKPSGDPSA